MSVGSYTKYGCI